MVWYNKCFQHEKYKDRFSMMYKKKKKTLCIEVKNYLADKTTQWKRSTINISSIGQDSKLSNEACVRIIYMKSYKTLQK